MTAEEVLRARARELARPVDDLTSTEGTRAVLRFRHRGARYVVPLADVRQVVPLAGVARLPSEAWPLVAVAAVAGEIVPVVELSRQATVGHPAWGVAVAADGQSLCLPADEVDGVAELPIDGLAATAAADPGGDDRGAVTTGGEQLLDVDALVASARRQRQDEGSDDDVAPARGATRT
jgi:chemotaxis signal transduction protein